MEVTKERNKVAMKRKEKLLGKWAPLWTALKLQKTKESREGAHGQHLFDISFRNSAINKLVHNLSDKLSSKRS